MNEEQNKTQQQEDLASIQMKQEQASERAALAQAQESELAGLQQNNQQRYNDLSQIVSEAETRLGELKQKDEVAQKRSNAFRYIAGVGDTLSGLANLVGTAHGAANQQQTYNGGMVAQRAEQSRKERKLEMDKISGRLDEMRAREKELKTAGSLAEAELKAKQNREQLELKSKQAATRREEDWKRTQQKWKEEEAARTQAFRDQQLAEEKRQFNATNARLAEAAAAENESRQAIKQMELEAKAQQQAAKNAADPKFQAQMLQRNITGIRDELASSMGYKDYNEYLQYNSEKVKGWGKDIDGVRNRISRDIRDERNERYPETVALLDTLTRPEDLTEEQIQMLIGASSVFADAVNKGATTSLSEEEEGDDEFDQFIRR